MVTSLDLDGAPSPRPTRPSQTPPRPQTVESLMEENEALKKDKKALQDLVEVLRVSKNFWYNLVQMIMFLI